MKTDMFYHRVQRQVARQRDYGILNSTFSSENRQKSFAELLAKAVEFMRHFALMRLHQLQGLSITSHLCILICYS